jgi:hypothetical protein
MSQTQDETPDSFPQIYVVSPPVTAMRVPVEKDPAQGHNVISYLKSGTVVKVLSKSELWLRIQLPNNSQGFIQAAQAHRATNEEMRALQTSNANDVSKSGSSSQQVVSTETGMTKGSGGKVPKIGLMFSLLGGAFSLCVFAAILASVQEQVCVVGLLAGCETSDPFQGLAIALFIFAGALLLGGIIAGIVALTSNATQK